MDLQLAGKRALVTGASSGIGRAVALQLAAEGVHVAVTARRAALLDGVAAAIRAHGVEAVAVPADVTDPGAAEQVVAAARRQLGGLDALVNSAGGSSSGGVLEVPDEAWEQNIQLKLLGTVRFSRAALPALTRPGGVIVNVVGGSGKRPSPRSAVNSVVNAGLLAFTELLAADAAGQGVRVVAVNPGLTETPLLERLVAARARLQGVAPDAVWEQIRASAPLGRLAQPGDTARTVAFLVSPLAELISGTAIDLGGPAAGR
ncbi:MAG TPA: SDR family oxidoreductase [Chloroflexota bacterium]|nr:SDR family oxidoreductase [Chloroflexota bacterium]